VSPAPAASSPQWVRIDPADTRMHPMWTASDRLSYDVAAAVLPAASAVQPSPMITRGLTQADVGAPMKVVGWGITSAGGSGAGTRREVDLPLRGLTAKHLQLGDQSGKGICNGDSGGPSFLTGRDGVRRVSGIHSYDSSLQCNDGLDTRVDLFLGFVQQFIRDKEGGPTCFEDGMCASGCTPADPDCVCQADGTCNPACPNLATDPDCPVDCGPNGVCATVSCPRLDPDCVAELSACTADTQCQYRTCATDPQRPERYCTRPCSAGCPTGTSCVGTVCLKPQLPTAAPGQPCTPGATFCVRPSQCTALPGAATTCSAICNTATDCGTPGECIDGENGFKVCKPTAHAGEACGPYTLCLDATTCTGFPDQPTTCETTCAGAGDCPVTGECLAAQNGQRLCRPSAQPGEACIAQTRCEGGTSCTGRLGDALSCQATCTGNADCGGSLVCEDAQLGKRVCVPAPVTLGLLGAERGQRAPVGCAAAPGSVWLALAAAAAALRRRRVR